MSGPAVVRWVEKRDREVTAMVGDELLRRLGPAGDAIKREAQALLGGPANAPEGEPPGEVSGKLKQSIKRRVLKGANPGVRVGPSDSKHKEQLGRLQKGYVGTDRAGRTYHQAPRPVLGKALKQATPEVKRILGVRD